MLQMTLTIKGKVQKVGFRYSVVNFVLAQHLPVVGYIRNLPDGSVHVLAQGDIESLKELHRFCRQGPPRSEVRELGEELVSIKKLDYTDFTALLD